MDKSISPKGRLLGHAFLKKNVFIPVFKFFYNDCVVLLLEKEYCF